MYGWGGYPAYGGVGCCGYGGGYGGGFSWCWVIIIVIVLFFLFCSPNFCSQRLER